MYFKVWGCRGSLPSPATMSFDTRRYGGNTTCYEIKTSYQDKEELFIIDMGTGLYQLGNKLLGDFLSGKIDKIRARIFITHIHLDHTFGMGFFAPPVHARPSYRFFYLADAGDPEQSEPPVDRFVRRNSVPASP